MIVKYLTFLKKMLHVFCALTRSIETPFMKFAIIVVILLLMSFVLQAQVVVRGIKLENNYEEFAADLVADSSFQQSFLNALEDLLSSKVGQSDIIYPGGKRIYYFDVRGFHWYLLK